MTPHLTEEQFADVLAADPRAESTSSFCAAQAHIAQCPTCAAELASMQESLALFREATTALAEAQLRNVPRPVLPMPRPTFVPQPALWAAAAAMLLLALTPLQRLHHDKPVPPTEAVMHAPAPAHTAISDEALLSAVDNEISESVPTPMQALADPASATPAQNSDQRKD